MDIDRREPQYDTKDDLSEYDKNQVKNKHINQNQRRKNPNMNHDTGLQSRGKISNK